MTVTRALICSPSAAWGIVSSNRLVLADHRKDGRVRLKVRPGNAGLFFGGRTILSTIAIAGLSIALAFSIPPGSSDRSLPVALGLGLGVASGVGAIALFATNATKVEFSPD